MTKDHPQLSLQHSFEAATQPGAPSLLLLHGSGGDQSSLLGVGRAIAPGAALLSPRGNVDDHGASRFFARLTEPCEATREVERRGLELTEFVQSAAKLYKISQPFIVAGFSHGANMALQLLLHSPLKWEGGILMRGMASEVYGPGRDLRGTPILILAGINDPLVQSDQVEELADQLRAANAEVTLHWEESGHNLCQGDVLMGFDWLRRFYAVPRPARRSQ